MLGLPWLSRKPQPRLDWYQTLSTSTEKSVDSLIWKEISSYRNRERDIAQVERRCFIDRKITGSIPRISNWKVLCWKEMWHTLAWDPGKPVLFSQTVLTNRTTSNMGCVRPHPKIIAFCRGRQIKFLAREEPENRRTQLLGQENRNKCYRAIRPCIFTQKQVHPCLMAVTPREACARIADSVVFPCWLHRATHKSERECKFQLKSCH